MKEKEKIQYGYGVSETHCEPETFDTVEELIDYVQKSWDMKDGNVFDYDCEDSGIVYVGIAESFEPSDFAPSLDDIADKMTDQFYCEHNIDDDADVQINSRKEAEAVWKEFINKHFELPYTIACVWFGKYDVKNKKWIEKKEKQ